MPGVYGDHSTDGWLEWHLDSHYALEAAGGDILEVPLEKFGNNPVLHSSRAEALDKLGTIAAAEARAQDVEIQGFEPAPEVPAEDRVFMGMPNADPAGYPLPQDILDDYKEVEAELRAKGIDPESDEGKKALRNTVGFRYDRFLEELTERLL